MRASYNPADMSTGGGFGMQEGNVKISGIVCSVVQYNASKDGRTFDPIPCVEVTYSKLDKDFAPLADETDETVQYSLGKLVDFHPGMAKDADDQEEEDLGDEVGTEGNIIYPVTNKPLNKSSKWGKYTDALVKAGFKPDVLMRGWLNDLLGTVGHVKTLVEPKNPNSTSDKPQTTLVFDSIVVFPYEKQKGTAANAAKGKTAAHKGVKPADKEVDSTPPPPAVTTTAAAPDDKVTGLAIDALTAVLDANPGATLTLNGLKSKVQMHMMKKRADFDPKLHAPILNTIKDPEWLAMFGYATDRFIYSEEEGVVIAVK